MSQSERSALAEWFRAESIGVTEIGSPFYGDSRTVHVGPPVSTSSAIRRSSSP